MNVLQGYVQVFRKASGRSLYVLVVLLFVYLINQLDRYALPITAKPMAQELKFGDKSCMLLPNATDKKSNECNNLNVTR